MTENNSKPKPPTVCARCKANGKDVQLRFSKDHVAASGRQIPVEVATGQDHQCPYSEWALKQAGKLPTPQAPATNTTTAIAAPTTTSTATTPASQPTTPAPAPQPSSTTNYAQELRIKEIKALVTKLNALVGGL